MGGKFHYMLLELSIVNCRYKRSRSPHAIPILYHVDSTAIFPIVTRAYTTQNHSQLQEIIQQSVQDLVGTQEARAEQKTH